MVYQVPKLQSALHAAEVTQFRAQLALEDIPDQWRTSGRTMATTHVRGQRQLFHGD